jgi:hypothetical protein
MTEKKIYLHCQCGCSVLHLEKDEDFGVELCMILFKTMRCNSWHYRLRQIWKIIRTGEPYEDQFVLRKQDIPKLVEFLRKEGTDKNDRK